MPDQTSTVIDPVGDAFFHAPAFQDIVFGQMTKKTNGDFELLMDVAASVPANPVIPPPARTEIWWGWGFELDPTAFPRGYPFTGSVQRRMEVLVFVSWDGAEFEGTMIDRRPLLTGGQAIVWPVEFSINGSRIEAEVPFALIGEVPTTFTWDAFTKGWSGPVGSEGDKRIDSAFAILK
jgi:hypothetical protein